MNRLIIIIILFLLTTLSFAADYDEVDLNTSPHEQTQFLNYPSVKAEFNKILALGENEPIFRFKYFVSYRNILPPGLLAGQYIANEHIAIFKSKLDSTICSVRVNVVWRNNNGKNVLDEDYSEPAQFYSCYKL